VQTTSDAPAPAQLGELLADPALRSDRRSAFTALYARWGAAPDGGGARCEAARPDGLECLFRTGTWTRMRRLGLPAIVELSGATGAKHYAVVTALGPRTATLEFGDRRRTLSLGEIDPFWDGAFILLWRPPSPGVATIGPGARAKDIQWLRQRLAAVDGQPRANGPAVYDNALRERVIAFQRSRSLVPDGIAGEETLTHLQAALRGQQVPALAAPGS
jgi:general secretion pathway protein A